MFQTSRKGVLHALRTAQARVTDGGTDAGRDPSDRGPLMVDVAAGAASRNYGGDEGYEFHTRIVPDWQPAVCGEVQNSRMSCTGDGVSFLVACHLVQRDTGRDDAVDPELPVVVHAP